MVKKIRSLFFVGIFNLLPELYTLQRYGSLFLKFAGMKILSINAIRNPINISPIEKCSNITIGHDTFINTGARFACPKAEIKIGNFVSIGPNVCFETVNHDLNYELGQRRKTYHKNIIIEDGVWIGSNSLILPGVRVEEGSVIAAGSVVTKNIPKYVLVAGVPARIIRKLSKE